MNSMNKKFFLSAGLTVAALVFAQAIGATIITVNDTGNNVDRGDRKCTLREAIAASNSNARSGIPVGECKAGQSLITDRIVFDITDGENMIFIDSALPTITEKVIIDASQGCGEMPSKSSPSVQRPSGTPPVSASWICSSSDGS